MTDIFLLTAGGKRLKLPPFTSWELKRTRNVPCDSFEGTCPWDSGLDDRLQSACRLLVEEDGARRFTGVVDETDLTWDGKGGRLELSARGLAALLLDNESPAMDYQVATLPDILRDHVEPYGIQVVKTASLPAVPSFSVSAGSSRWQVLYQFARYHGGVEPTFDELGRLTMAPLPGRHWTIGGKTGVTAITCRDKRYGVWSQVLVQNRKTQTTQRLVNEAFAAQGLCCGRVLTVPGKSGYQAMRWTGQYQLDRSAEERFRLELTLSNAGPYQPGDTVTLSLEKPRLSGVYKVLETCTAQDSRGLRTRLTLGSA